MKPIGVISTAALLLIFGSAQPATARQEKPQEKARPAQQEKAKPEKQEQAKPAEHQTQAKPEKQEQAKAPKQEAPAKQQQAKTLRQEAQAKPGKQQQQAKAPKQAQAKPERQQQAKAQQQPHQQAVSSSQPPRRTQQAIARQRAQPALRLSARGSGRIPDDCFRASFGSGHNFHMGNPVLVGGYSRFQYSGFWFGFVEPWPVGWYYTDNLYIDYVDGEYYMYNPYHPGARFAISVVL